MTIRTQLKAGGLNQNHSEALQVRSALKAGAGCTSGQHFPTATLNHNEVLQIRSTLRAGGSLNHNEALRRNVRWPTVSIRRRPRTAARKENRLQLLVVRAGLRGGWSWGKGRR
jgi:hypothetical protein